MTEITSITLAQNGTTVTLNGVRVSKPKSPVLGRMQIWGGDEIVQLIGHKAKGFIVQCTLKDSGKDTDKANLEAMRDSNDIATYNDTEEGNVDVFVDCDFPQEGGRAPVAYKGTITCVRAD